MPTMTSWQLYLVCLECKVTLQEHNYRRLMLVVCETAVSHVWSWRGSSAVSFMFFPIRFDWLASLRNLLSSAEARRYGVIDDVIHHSPATTFISDPYWTKSFDLLRHILGCRTSSWLVWCCNMWRIHRYKSAVFSQRSLIYSCKNII